MTTAKLYVDGSAFPNPGPGGIGFIIWTKGKQVLEGYQHIGESTNNEAEYKALIVGLTICSQEGYDMVKVYSDSLLVVKQINREYSIYNERLKQLCNEALSILSRFECHTVNWIPNRENREADRLAKRASKLKDKSLHLIKIKIIED
jgi:ribonuclease HI